jgi:GNAT superfamily N-acetyltransferase
MEIRALDVADDAAVRRFHQILWRAEKEDGRPWNPMWTHDEFAAMVRKPTSERRMVSLAAYDGGEMVGTGFMMLSDLDNLDTAWTFVAVEPERRGRGIGQVVLDGLIAAAGPEGRTQLLGGAGVPFEERDSSPIVTWALAHGFTVANTEIQRNLELPVADDLLDEIEREVREKSGGYEIRTYVGPLPDDVLASYADLSNLFMLEAPMGDVEVEAGRSTPESLREQDEAIVAMGRTRYSALAFKGDVVVAHSDLGTATGDDEAHQWGTLVHPDHRGHRLGAAVKVANLRNLMKRDPATKRVVTTNAETNAWMVAINERLGFVPVAVVPTFKRRLTL